MHKFTIVNAILSFVAISPYRLCVCVSASSARYCNSIIAFKSIARSRPILQLVDGLEKRKLQSPLLNVPSKMAALLFVIGVPLRVASSKAWDWGRQILRQVPLVILHFMIFSFPFTCYISAYAVYDVRGVCCLLYPGCLVLCSNSAYVIRKCY